MKTLALVASLSLSFTAVTAQEPLPSSGAPREDRPYWRTNLFRRVFTDQKYLVTEWWPSELRRPGFSVPLLGATVAALSSQHAGEHSYDFSLGTRMDNGSRGSTDAIAGGFTRLGNGAAAAGLLGATYLVSRWTGHDRLAETSSLSAESLLDAGIWITVLKGTFARVRPNGTQGGTFFQYGRPHADSFPSGHAMGAFALASVFAEQYRDKRWVGWCAYGTATLIGTSRVALGRHFPADVLVGGLLGTSIGRGVVARARGEDLERQKWMSHLTPVLDPAGSGYGLAYTASW